MVCANAHLHLEIVTSYNTREDKSMKEKHEHGPECIQFCYQESAECGRSSKLNLPVKLH